ncbi:hypothetical protein [Spiroplasma endosymbiont of Phyllotreta cruciferae]|uniref:hypothetical protein n=1 Tax=Spiroplasma endosymbiont of Phyllotreta cruciferae TaxID=2886375 RepID=UPI0020A1A8D5|nr:hypothetical protein [Spiroplasma endosymbiont of Phyllotreta cruciferae]
MANRKYWEDCQEDNYYKVIGDSIVWIFPDDRYTQEEINFIVNECSSRELRQNFKAKQRYVCESCSDKYC